MSSHALAVAGLDELESPAYLYDLEEIRRSHAELRAALPQPSELYYSLKANPHPAVVTELRAAGCLAEVSSSGELRTALEVGFAPAQVLYTGPGKRDRDVQDAIRSGIELFSVDSAYALDQLDAAAGAQSTEVRALVRINDSSPAQGHGLTMTGVASQFGADADWVLAQPDRFGPRDAVATAGFHLYMGSNIAGEDALLAQFAQAAASARRLADAVGIEVSVLDLGGGFGAPFARAGVRPSFPDLARRLSEMLDETFPAWRDGSPTVAFESGRYLTATCGTLLTRVLDVKRSQGRPVVVLDAGINHLGGMSGLRRLPPIVPDLLHIGQGTNGAAAETVSEAIIAGPLCSPTDSWARSATVASLTPGQLVGVPNVGAYGLSASLVAFLGHPLATEVAFDGERITDISRLELRRQRVTDAYRS
jgi:diaminopimelate decarboxylase